MRDDDRIGPDVVGMGALNVDYIASASKLSAKLTEHVAEWAARFEWNFEAPADEPSVHRIINQLGAAVLDVSLGGSAWNTIFGLAQMRTNLTLGYVGIVGTEYPGLSFLRQMDQSGIDRRFVAQSRVDPCGLCLSFIEDDERVMLTYPGANVGMAQHVRDNFDAIAAYLASARVVHVTSFLDPQTPAELLSVLQRARQLSTRMKVSVDPGHNWAAYPTEPVLRLFELADYLLVTNREFKALGGRVHGESDMSVAQRVLAKCSPHTAIIVAKRYDTVDIFRAESDGVTSSRFSQRLPPAGEIEDTTGAGDAFAAGLLAGLVSRRLQVELGACLGLSLARHTMRHRPFEGHAAFPDLTHGFLQSAEQPYSQPRPIGVFVAHGDDPQWLVVRNFLEQDHGIPAYSLDENIRGDHLAEQMRDHLSRCSFGVCLLSAHTSMSTNQDVVHQAGILQGRYGFERVAMLVEEGCEVFSNVAGLIRLDFHAGHVDSTFWHLEMMLRREGVLRIT